MTFGMPVQLRPMVELVLVNAFLIYLLALVRLDQLSRLDYWRTLGFSPAAVYSVLTLRYPATTSTGPIPGLPTLDWVQVLLVVLIVTDTFYLVSPLGARRHRKPPADVLP